MVSGDKGDGDKRHTRGLMTYQKLVVTQAFAGHNEGDVIDAPEEVASKLVESGFCREASPEEANGNAEAKDEAPAEDQVENTLKRITGSVERTVDAAVNRLAKTRTPAPKPMVQSTTVPAEAVDKKAGFRSATDVVRCVIAAEHGDGSAQKKLRGVVSKTAQQTEGTNSEGGYTVPTHWSEQIFQKVWDYNALLNRCTAYPMRSNHTKIPALDEAQGSSGIVANWISEYSTITQSSAPFTNIDLNLSKLAVFVPITEELTQDNPYALDNVLLSHCPKKINFKLNSALLSGGNANQANIIGGASTVTVTRQTASHITYQDVTTMYSRLWQESIPNAVWIINPSNLGELYRMAFTSGGTTPVFVQNNGLYSSAAFEPAGTLMGRPVLALEGGTQALGVSGDIILLDPSQIAVGYRALDTAMSSHFYFDKYANVLRLVLRVGSAPLWTQTWTRQDGTTASPYVVLSNTSGTSALAYGG